jgi:hypothetical protein
MCGTIARKTLEQIRRRANGRRNAPIIEGRLSFRHVLSGRGSMSNNCPLLKRIPRGPCASLLLNGCHGKMQAMALRAQ